LTRTYRLSVFLLILTAIVFIRVPFFDFVQLEDPTHLDSHPQFSSSHATNIFDLWKRPYLIYMPATYSVWNITGKLNPPQPLDSIPRTQTGVLKKFRFNSFVFHCLPILFHLANVFVLFWLLCFLTGHPLGSFFGALFFGIHPLQVESVAWVSGLKETLGGFWGFLAILTFLLGQEMPPRSRGFKFLFLGSTVLFLLSLLSNPSYVAVPIAAAALMYFLYRKERFFLGARLLSLWLALSAPAIWIGRSTRYWAHTPETPLHLKDKVVLALDSLSFYFSKILFPLNLGIDYGRTPDWVLNQTSVHTTAAVFFIFLFSLTLFLKWNKIQWALAGEAFFIFALLPLFLFNRLLFQTSSSVADHDLYFPLAGLALAIAFFLRTFSKKSGVPLVFTLLLITLATRSYFQTGFWKDTPTLLNHALEINSESSIAHRNLGYYYEKEEDYPQAISHFKSSVALHPQAQDFSKIANIYLTKRDYQEARTNFERALNLNPLSSTDYHGLGLSWLGLGNKPLAQENFAKANALTPRNLSSKNALRQVTRDLRIETKQANRSRRKSRH